MIRMNRMKWKWLGGIAFTLLISCMGYMAALLPGIDRVGPLACAILIAVVYRQIWGYPESLRQGIQFSAKKLLRYAIVLYGLKLNMDVVFHHGLEMLLRDIGTIIFSIIVMMALAKWLKAESSLSLLLGIGTGVCGAAAIAAVSPIVKAKDEDTAIGVGMIALIGTLFAILYTVMRPFLPLSPTDYGSWAGTSLHEIAHVALAAAPAGQDALAVALLAKLGRVFLLVPLCFILMIWMRHKGKDDSNADSRIEFPWFLVGFIIMSMIGSYVLGDAVPISTNVLDHISEAATFLLTMAMTGLGLNVNIRDLRSRAFRPLIAMTITSILLSLFTYSIL